ncbi:hypothetical protein Tco_0142278, partial [Tanacetum coccineum]
LPAVTSKVPYLVALVAPLGARAIVVEITLVTLGQGSPIRLPFACPHVVDFGDILPFEGLLLLTMVVSGVPVDRSHVHIHDHDGSGAPDESPGSILSNMSLSLSGSIGLLLHHPYCLLESHLIPHK